MTRPKKTTVRLTKRSVYLDKALCKKLDKIAEVWEGNTSLAMRAMIRNFKLPESTEAQASNALSQ